MAGLQREIDPSTERDLHRAVRALRRRAYNRGMYLRTRRTALEDGPVALLRLFAEHPGAIPAAVGGIVKRLRGGRTTEPPKLADERRACRDVETRSGHGT